MGEQGEEGEERGECDEVMHLDFDGKDVLLFGC